MFTNVFNAVGSLLEYFADSSIKEVSVAEPRANLRGKSMNQVIEEIHETFYTEVDKLLASAKVLKSLETTKQDLIDKCKRLRALGFTNTKEVKEAELEIERLSNLEMENLQKEKLIRAINHFSFKYPNYKFITEESVKKICAKYNLIYSTIDRYIGTVPDKNLKHMEDFRIEEVDECWISQSWSQIYSMLGSFGHREKFCDIHKIKERKEDQEKLQQHPMSQQSIERYFNRKCPLEIAAPLSDFNTEGLEVKDFKLSKIEIPDPIVLKPVIFEGQKHYLIVTAWGLEASDQDVINEKMN
jgi:hypothetical protein